MRSKWIDWMLDRFGYGAMLLWCGVVCFGVVTNQLPLLFLHESIGNGDSFIFQSVEAFMKTGVLYPEWGPEHLVPTLYSPLLYWMHAFAWKLVPAANPYIGPRLLELGWFVGCMVATALLGQRLVPGAKIFRLGLLMAASFSTMGFWVMQLRSDFPGITCSLFALYFLMSRKTSDFWWAGLFAGLAVQFKVPFVAAGLTGLLWLAAHKRWGDLARFAGLAGISSVGLYALAAWYEPEMLSNILMLSKMIPHPAGAVVFVRQVLAEPVFLLALSGLLAMSIPLMTQRRPRLQLLVLFLGLSGGIAIYTSVQAGASINYFYEPLFASTPLAVLGMLRLKAGRLRSAGVFVGLLVLIPYVLPRLIANVRGGLQVSAQVAERNRAYDDLRVALDGTKLLSSLPDVTVLRPERVITDSVLLNYLVLTRAADLASTEARIRDAEFDLVVTQTADYAWRGVPVLARGIRGAIMETYRPHCVLRNMLVHLPKDEGGRTGAANLQGRLERLGCEQQTCQPGSKCAGLGVAVEAFVPTF